MKRDAFLRRIGEALGRAEGEAVAPPPPPPPAATVAPSLVPLGTTEALVERFVERARAAGAEVHRVQGREAGGACAAAAARTAGASVCAGDDDIARQIARASGLAPVAPELADVGVTSAWRGVVETGTVVLRAEGGRLEGLLPPVHVVLLRVADLRPSLVELYADLDGDPPSALVQITGPSRTADIEMTLTTGVHGPGTVVVVLVDAG